MNLYDAAELRMSVRSFVQEELSHELLDEIDQYIAEIQGYIPAIDVNIEIVKTLDKMMRPPYYAILYSEEKEGCYLNAGYIMEQLVLYLTSRGVASCFKLHPLGRNSRDAVGRKYMICIAFGLAKDEVYRNPDKAKRLPLERMCVMKAKPTAEMYKLLEIGRLAPSSFNNQPWRVVVTEGWLHIFKRDAGSKMTDRASDIDLGIMLANMVVGAEELWIDITVKHLEEVASRNYNNNQYITSIRMDRPR